MGKKQNQYNEVLNVLIRLHKSYPNYTMGQHIATAIDDANLWSLSDKELLSLLEDYESYQELDKKINDDHFEVEDLERDYLDD